MLRAIILFKPLDKYHIFPNLLFHILIEFSAKYQYFYKGHEPRIQQIILFLINQLKLQQKKHPKLTRHLIFLLIKITFFKPLNSLDKSIKTPNLSKNPKELLQ
jgi:hypothetical protein